MSVQECFSDAASEKSHNYVPDEMKHDFLLLTPQFRSWTETLPTPVIRSHAEMHVSVPNNWRFSEAVISATLGA